MKLTSFRNITWRVASVLGSDRNETAMRACASDVTSTGTHGGIEGCQSLFQVSVDRRNGVFGWYIVARSSFFDFRVAVLKSRTLPFLVRKRSRHPSSSFSFLQLVSFMTATRLARTRTTIQEVTTTLGGATNAGHLIQIFEF